MCVNLRGLKSSPGNVFPVISKKGTGSSIWGFNSGISGVTPQHNARSEKLDTLYKNFERGIVKVDSFWERSRFSTDLIRFTREDGKLFNLACVLNKNNEFGVLTVNAIDPILTHHPRMPLILDDDRQEMFFDNNGFWKFFQLRNYNLENLKLKKI